MPDFGYAEDNYILDNQGKDKWKMLTGLLGDSKRFAWLMNFLLLKRLENDVKDHQDQERMTKELRAKMRLERKVKFAQD